MKNPDQNLQRRAADCDVMLLLEGTFPFVSGGVSSWVNQLILGLTELTDLQAEMVSVPPARR